MLSEDQVAGKCTELGHRNLSANESVHDDTPNTNLALFGLRMKAFTSLKVFAALYVVLTK